MTYVVEWAAERQITTERGTKMPRKPAHEDARFIELRAYVTQVDESGRKSIDYLKNEIAEKLAKMQYQKSKAIIQALDNGLSVYAAAKAAGIKSSSGRINLTCNAQRIVAEYESRGKQ